MGLSAGRRKKHQIWNDKVANELFLWKRLFADGSSSSQAESRSEGREDPDCWGSEALSSFLQLVERSKQPSILDLGPVTNSNISFYGEMGFKVYAFDLLREYREAIEKSGFLPPWNEEESSSPNPIEAILKDFDYEPDSLSGVLCWEVLERLPMIWTRDLIQRIYPALERKGVIFSMFKMEYGDSYRRSRGFQIREGNRLKPLPDVGTWLEPYQYENGDIVSLFSGFKVLNFYVMNNNVREIIVQKQS